MGTRLHTPTTVSLWPGESVVGALERLARAWDLDRTHFVGRSGALGRVALRVGASGAGRPRARAVPWADVVCLAGEIRIESRGPVVAVKAVLCRARVLERGTAEYLSGDLVSGEVREPVDLSLSDGAAAVEPVADLRSHAESLPADSLPAEPAAVFV